MTRAEEMLPAALAAFDFGGRVTGAVRYGRGHINDTFAVSTAGEGGRFILQRINTHVFRDVAGLMGNICGVTGYLRRVIEAEGGNPDRETLTVLPDRHGNTWFRDPADGCWRVYLFVEDTVCHQVAADPEVFRAAAATFGRFARQLEGYPAHTLHETIPFFHDTRRRFANFAAALAADQLGRAAGCERECAFALTREGDCGTLMNLLEAGEIPLRVAHNDTKLNNILMAPGEARGVCVIDLDTVMPGLALHDFGDAIRYGANTATEDEKDLAIVDFSLPLFQTYTEGYLATAAASLTRLEKELLPWGARLMALECGLRFLTDHLEGDVYFRTAYPGHNLNRARTQFKLTADMERDFGAMQAIVEKII